METRFVVVYNISQGCNSCFSINELFLLPFLLIVALSLIYYLFVFSIEIMAVPPARISSLISSGINRPYSFIVILD